MIPAIYAGTLTDGGFVEPEVLWHTGCVRRGYFPDHPLFGSTSQLTLVGSTDDAAARSRRYRCETCGTEVSVHFPPEVPR